MKFFFTVFFLLIGSFIGFFLSLQNGSFLRYLDTHPHEKVVPPTAFWVGQGYNILGDLQTSATYYQRIADRYPKSRYADDSYYNYLKSLDDMDTPRREMAELYATYLERYPQGNHAEVVTKQIEYCRNAPR